MQDELIKCPQCGCEIQIAAAIESSLRDRLKEEAETAMSAERLEVERHRKMLIERENLLVVERASYENQVKERVTREIEKEKQKIKSQIQDDFDMKVSDLSEQIKRQNEKLENFKQRELKLLDEKRIVEESKKDIDLEIARKLEAERPKIESAITEKYAEESRLKDIARDKEKADLKKQLDDMKRKVEQGSQQLQGEVQELKLEEYLRLHFPKDTVEPVPKGIEGADVLQRIHNDAGQFCGTIIWESKRTKNWSDSWLAKLRADQVKARADLAVIFTTTLPNSVSHFALMDGVWLTDYTSLHPLATALRYGLVEIAMTRLVSAGKNEKIEILYNYLTGPEFVRRISMIADTFAAMQSQLTSEKAAMNRIWNQREKQIQTVLENTSALCGEIEGIAGSNVIELPSLELKSLPGPVPETEEDSDELPF